MIQSNVFKMLKPYKYLNVRNACLSEFEIFAIFLTLKSVDLKVKVTHFHVGIMINTSVNVYVSISQ